MAATKIGRWWYPMRVNRRGGVIEVYYPTKNPTWQNADKVRKDLAERTKRKA